MDDEKLYAHLVAINNAEQSIYWTRYNIQSVINTAAIGGYAVALKENRLSPFWLIVLPIGGLALAAMWGQMTLAGNQWMDFWQNRLRDIERRWPAASALPRPFVMACEEFQNRSTPGVRRWAQALVALFVFSWLALEIIELVRFVRVH